MCACSSEAIKRVRERRKVEGCSGWVWGEFAQLQAPVSQCVWVREVVLRQVSGCYVVGETWGLLHAV